MAYTTEPTIYCGSGYATLIYGESDKLFEKQYKVRYIIVGCLRDYTVEEMSFHNKSIAKFLDRKFGSKWRAGLRPDVFGITY